MVLKFKGSLSWKSICLLICSYLGESKSIALQAFFINLVSFGALERQVSLCILKPQEGQERESSRLSPMGPRGSVRGNSVCGEEARAAIPLRGDGSVGCRAAAVAVSDGCRGEKHSLLLSVAKNNNEIMSYLCVGKDVGVVGSFGICHHKELTEPPACGTLSHPYLSCLGVIFFKFSFASR